MNLVTNASSSGIAGVICQGDDWRTAKVTAFFSAKLTSTQQNYPVHKQELFVGVESMRHHWDILQGVHFWWYMDHKGLMHLLKQKNLSPCQVRWMELLLEFDFEIIYIEGTQNILCDALSCLYANDAAGTVRSSTEYLEHDDENHVPTADYYACFGWIGGQCCDDLLSGEIVPFMGTKTEVEIHSLT